MYKRQLLALLAVWVCEIRARLSKRHPEPSASASLSKDQDPPAVRRVPFRIVSGETGQVLPSLGLATQADASTASTLPQREKQEMNQVAEWAKPSKEVLIDMAKRCEVRVVSPAIMENQAPTVDDQQAAALSLSSSERAELNRTLQQMHDRFADSARPLFGNGTDDSNRPSSLDEMIVDMRIREDSGFHQARQKLALERAGMAPPPASDADLPAGERFLRLWAGLGDEFEQRLANSLGADRARQLRFSANALPWTSRYVFTGCPTPQ